MLLQESWADAATIAKWRADAVQQVEAAVATVQREAPPNPFQEDWSAIASKQLAETHPET